MRIALFTETYHPMVNGVVSHVKLLKEGLEKMGHEVMVVTTDPKAHKHYLRQGILYCPGKRIKRVYGYGLAMPVSGKRYKYLKQFDPDIVHIHTEFSIGLFGLWIAKVMKKPVVYTMHTIYDEYLYYLVPKMLTRAGQKVFYGYIRKIAKRADLIMGPSKKSEEFLRRAGVKKKVDVVGNGVDINKFSPNQVTKKEKQKIREIYGIPEDSVVGCSVSRIGKEKSIDVLIRYIKGYMEKNEKYYLMIVGDGPTKVELEELTKDMGLQTRIKFTGKVLNKDLLPYYGTSDMFITASLSDTNSISMLEAMAMGLPVLQRYDEINKDQVIEGENGYIFNDAKTMAEKIETIINMDEKERERLAQRVRESVRNRGLEEVAKQVEKRYNKVIKGFRK